MTMQELNFWQVDAFTHQVFKGNPAAVFILREELDEVFMQNIAMEMNLSETAFVWIREGKNPLIRWFTPTLEIDLCGHATLASAHIYLSEIYPELSEVTFDTKLVGPLSVEKKAHAYTMRFPSRAGDKIEVSEIPSFVLEALTDVQPIEAYKARDLMLIYDNEQIIHDITPNFSALRPYENHVIVTAESNGPRYDFVSRFFVADDGIAEDPVTGSAHCTSTPYWSSKLGKKQLRAYQASKRGGELTLEVINDCIIITGEAVTLIDGKMRFQT